MHFFLSLLTTLCIFLLFVSHNPLYSTRVITIPMLTKFLLLIVYNSLRSSFIHKCTRTWNNLPVDAVSSTDLRSFKFNIFHHFSHNMCNLVHFYFSCVATLCSLPVQKYIIKKRPYMVGVPLSGDVILCHS